MKLIIDTSSLCTLVLVTSDNWELIDYEIQSAILSEVDTGMSSHNEALSILVKKIIDKNPANISEIVIGIGPGSFTGIRIGLSFAIGLAIGSHARIRAISSFELISKLFVVKNTPGIVLSSDARRSEFFVYVAKNDGNVVLQEQIVAQNELGEIKATYAEYSHFDLSTTSSFEDILRNSLQNRTQDSSNRLLQLSSSGSVYAAGNYHLIEPLYLREVAARTIAQRTSAA